jgi:UDP-N-acetylglucosamine pyrophosphorylase
MAYSNWVSDATTAVNAFNSIKSIVEQAAKIKITSIEQVNNDLCVKFDSLCGCDYLAENSLGLYGIAMRVQFKKNWQTFTIREARDSGAKTEFHKRSEQIKQGYFYPRITIQAYFSDEVNKTFLGGCLIKTKDLFDYIESGGVFSRNRTSNASFIVVRWDDLRRHGVEMIILRPDADKTSLFDDRKVVSSP